MQEFGKDIYNRIRGPDGATLSSDNCREDKSNHLDDFDTLDSRCSTPFPLESPSILRIFVCSISRSLGLWAGPQNWSSLTADLQKGDLPVIWPSSDGYANLAEPFNLRVPYKPAVIVVPQTEKHVQDAVACAAQAGLKVQAKSGGHSYASFSSGGVDGHMVISLQNFHTVSVNTTTGVAFVGGCVRLGNLASEIFRQGRRALPHRTCPGVGVGGHVTHGGYGHTSRKWGISLDRIVGADVVLADTSFIHASKDEHSDMFWAIRGAAESFGIVTTFYMQTEQAPETVTYFSFKWEGMFSGSKETFVHTFERIEEFARNGTVADDRISFGIYLDGTVYNLGGTFFGTPSEFQNTIQPEFLRGLPTPASITVQQYTWLDYLVLMSDKDRIEEPLTWYDKHDNFFVKSVTVPEDKGMSRESLGAMFDVITAGSPTAYFAIINLYSEPGSSINAPFKHDPRYSAYPHRSTLWVLQLYAHTPKPTVTGTLWESANISIPFITTLHDTIVNAAPGTEFGGYVNYVDPSLSKKEAHRAYYGEETYKRFQEVKRQVDPGMLFWHPQAVEV